MKNVPPLKLFLFSLIISGAFSCSKTETFEDPLADYIPLAKGKFITYRLDSTVFTNFQQTVEVHSYQVRHLVDEVFQDNLGHTSYRIFRYIRDVNGTQEWQGNGSYYITVLPDQVEVVEDNLRFIKLHAPMKEGTTWKGNKYLPSDPYEAFGYAFSNDNNMKDWDFTVDSFEPSLTYSGQTYNDVFVVEEEDYSDKLPITPPQPFAIKTRAVEKYAKDIGLVYREYELWEYQGNTGTHPFYIGFGIKMWMIDHN